MTLLFIHSLTVADATGNRRLDRLSLDVDGGRVLGITGGPGAGKSLLCDILSGARHEGLKIIGGRILFGSRDLTAELSSPDTAPTAPIAIYDHPSAVPGHGGDPDVGAIVVDRDPASLEEVCDEIAVLCVGRLVERAPAAEVVKAPRHPYTQALLDGKISETQLDRVDDGCPFRPACPHSEPACNQAIMRLQMISEDHATACARWRTLWPAAA